MTLNDERGSIVQKLKNRGSATEEGMMSENFKFLSNVVFEVLRELFTFQVSFQTGFLRFFRFNLKFVEFIE